MVWLQTHLLSQQILKHFTQWGHLYEIKWFWNGEWTVSDELFISANISQSAESECLPTQNTKWDTFTKTNITIFTFVLKGNTITYKSKTGIIYGYLVISYISRNHLNNVSISHDLRAWCFIKNSFIQSIE